MTALQKVDVSLSSVLPATQYFEIDSPSVRARFAVWVTLPVRYYGDTDRSYPVVYQPDGNRTAPTTANPQLTDDPIHPIEPIIQVQVGYTGIDAGRMLAVRARDLLPPGEPLDPSSDEKAMADLVEAGWLTAPDAGLYLHNLRNPAADRFLAFLCDELHPAIAAMFRVDSTKLGLHGYSYGGLFATWVAMQRSIFTRVGASSPGILADTSEVLRRYDAELAADADHSGRSLHLTVYEKEITNSSCYNRLVGQGTVQLMSRLAERPLRGLQWSSRILGEESHATGGASSYFNFLRTCYPAQTPSGLLS